METGMKFWKVRYYYTNTTNAKAGPDGILVVDHPKIKEEMATAKSKDIVKSLFDKSSTHIVSITEIKLTTYEKKVLNLLEELESVDLRILGELPDRNLSTLESAFTSRALSLGIGAEYLGFRGGFGCGDSGHDKATDKSQKSSKKLCKALGYSYP